MTCDSELISVYRWLNYLERLEDFYLVDKVCRMYSEKRIECNSNTTLVIRSSEMGKCKFYFLSMY